MEMQTTNSNFAKDYRNVKRELREIIPPMDIPDNIPEWKTWIDLDIDDIKDITYYLLYQLLFGDFLTSATKTIPLMDSTDIQVGVTMYMSKDDIYRTHQRKSDITPTLMSSEDFVSLLAKTAVESEDSYGMNAFYALEKIAWKMRLHDEFREKVKDLSEQR